MCSWREGQLSPAQASEKGAYQLGKSDWACKAEAAAEQGPLPYASKLANVATVHANICFMNINGKEKLTCTH